MSDGNSFALLGTNVSYRFHVDLESGDLISDHFGSPATEDVQPNFTEAHGWVGMPGRLRREYPDLGRGDFRLPAIRIRQSTGHTVTELRYRSHDIIDGKPELPGLPSTFGAVSTLIVHMYDEHSSVAVDLSYSLFPQYDTIVRSAKVTNDGEQAITVENLASFSIDMPFQEYEMIHLRGDWNREAAVERRKVHYGTQG